MDNKLKIGFIGAGTVAKTLAVALKNKGYGVAAVSSRSLQSAQKLAGLIDGCCALAENQQAADAADIVFITTPDDVIAPAAAGVRWRTGQSAVHCSGADSTDLLVSAKEAGAEVGVFHPLQTFASLRQENLPGITYAIEAEEPLLSVLKKMAADLGGNWIEIKPQDKVLYHAAAVFACNYLVTLTKTATDLWQGFGVPQQQAIQALLPLMKGTISNIENSGIPQCLTGPIARGDAGTIKKHLKALKTASPELLPTYRELGLKTIPIALAKGRIDRKQAHKLESILQEEE